ncbi:uncharacterized protein [Rutidosis leptorrhynchoides]|uniref:uncharacterized protein isoform X2 n=1 Tax=Rutidosis leptorrhynchoides TaxID=125765 RepID=UPI003A99821E
MSILQDFNHLKIPYADIKKATNNFSDENVIAEGGYGTVYKGELLLSGSLTKIVVKRIDGRFSRAENHFINEITVRSSYNKHVNIVSLIGFCDEYNEKILVEEFVPYGTLDTYITSTKLTWLKRVRICVGASRGLNYLHNSSVLHRDIRSRMILLGENWDAKIGGFGVAIRGPMERTVFVNNIIGAPGYVDPTYMQTGVVTKESDVYSFGVVLFEVLCGRLAYERNENNQQFLGPFARLHYEEGRLNEIIDPFLREQMSPESLEAFSAIAYHCLEKQQSDRPNMDQIVEKLVQVLRLQQEFEKVQQLFKKKDDHDLKGKNQDAAASYKVKNLEHMKIPLEHIKLATNDFHDDFKIGSGGYGKVYKADLFHFDVQKYVNKNIYQGVSVDELMGSQRRKGVVAIKRLDRRYGQGPAEFLQEISVLPYFRHQNLVTLVGFCDENHERILVYEYASNGSLDRYISSVSIRSNDKWALRLQICLDAARGIEFLHDGVGLHHRIIHRDIKSSNILLGHNWVGKISDFGLSRIGPANLQATFVMTQVAGTLEYVDPQYRQTGMLTKESDVYSFGVVLFEVLSGRLAYFPRTKDGQEFLPHMAKRCIKQKKLDEIIDPKLKKEFEKSSSTSDDETFPDSVSIFAGIAYKCLQKNRDDRPTMAEVVEELENALRSHVKGVETLRTSLDAIKFATNNFSNVFEHEGYGMVYLGELSDSKGQNAVIVKKLDRLVGSYEDEFYKDIAMLYSYSHSNIIPILGFCEEASERIVIFQNLANGSLKNQVKNISLTWKQRLNICIDVARGLAHIHSAADAQHSVHGDIKSSSILLSHDWKAVISNYIILKGLGTLGYYDPLYETVGILTQNSDIYSFGVVLFEILSGRLAIETSDKDGRVIFLSHLATQCFKNKRFEEIIFYGFKGQIDEKCLTIFSTVAFQCLQEEPENRPTMVEVVKELEKAFECQDEWEWEQKLPRDYQAIIQLSKYRLSNIRTKKDLYTLLSSGIVLNKERLWFSINKDGLNSGMVSATKFSYVNVKWRPIRSSRFSKAAKISDNSKLNVEIQLKTQFLTPETLYGAYLVFKFCDRRKISSRPVYVNLKYKKSGETLNAYFAKWKAESDWLMIELFRFWNNKESIDFDVSLKSFSRYYCGSGGIFVEGLEFNPIANRDCKEDKGLNYDNSERELLKFDADNDTVDQMAIECREIIKRSKISNRNASKEELYFLLFNGVHVDNGEKFFSLSEVNGKKCLMLSAKAVIYDTSHVKLYNKTHANDRCIFAESVEILAHHELHIKCDIETQMLSSDTAYACFLVFKLSDKCRGLKCPIKARELLPYKKERTKIISLTCQSFVNLDNIKWVPEQREDGWMEVVVWETVTEKYNAETIPMDLKLICFEGTMAGLIVCGIRFCPI